MTFRDKLAELSDETQAKVLDIFTAYSAGRIDRDTAVAAIAATVARGNARAVSLADLALAANVMTATRQPQATLGLSLPDDETERLQKAATTLLAVHAVTPERVGRLGWAEPFGTGQRAFSEAIIGSGKVTGWTRHLNPGACQLCQWWAREGRVWPADHPMQTHKGCTCTQSIVTADQIQETVAGRRERIAREAEANTRRYNP